MRRWIAALTAALALAACGPAGEAAGPSAYTGPPKPALWKIADADTTIYFFGTIHLLPPALDWQTPAFTTALTEARAVYLEADTEIPAAEINAIVQRTAILPPDQNLSDLLDPAQREALRAAASRLDVSPVALERMRPWYAGVLLSDTAIRETGFAQDYGVEAVLRPAARGAGKELRYLETVDSQLSAYTVLPNEVQVRLLDDTVKELGTASASLTEMVNAWRAGDDATLSRLVIDEQLATQPEIYETLMVRRNAAWAPKLDTVMRSETGTLLVAVGAGHLLGPDSVLVQMERLGYRPERVQ
jgi:uncharacterized protein YbaP (TraB family)